MATTSKRQKQLAAAKAERQRERRMQAEARRRRRLRIVVGAVVVAMVLASAAGIGFLLTSSSGEDDAVAAGCGFVPFDGPRETPAGLPDAEPPAAGTTATITLDGTPVVVDLQTTTAGCATSSWAHLAEQDYFDGTACHRLTTSETLQVLQCGDPTGTGQGGPGYRFDDESLDTAAYAPGTVAMANSGPDTNGSQFFIVWGQTQLPPSYTVVGQVSEGLDAVQAIAEAGIDGRGTDGEPAAPAVIDDLEVDPA